MIKYSSCLFFLLVIFLNEIKKKKKETFKKEVKDTQLDDITKNKNEVIDESK